MSTNADTIRKTIRILHPIYLSDAKSAMTALDALLAENEQLRAAITHYANVDHWAEEPGDVYTTWGYDGGEALPWKVAAEALVRG